MKPPASIESDDAEPADFRRRGARRRAASATDGDARFVGSCDTDDTGSPQAGQKRADPGTSAKQDGQRIKLGGL